MADLPAAPPTEFLVDLFENGAIGLHIVGPDGTIQYANRAELALLGYEAGEYIGKPIADFHADQCVISDILSRLTAGETLDKYPAQLKAKDGSVKHVLISSSVYFDDAGGFRNTRCFTLDVTDRREAEEALRQAEQRLTATFDHALAGISEIDKDGVILRANTAMEGLTGYSKAELLGRSVFELTHPDDVEADRAEYARQVRGEIDRYEVVKRYIRADGSAVWVHVLSTVVTGPDGKFLYGVRVAHDVSEQKLRDERNKLLINELNHRVKNTLSTVQSLAKHTGRTSEGIDDFLGRFEGRLLALSKAHDRLTRRNWEGASLKEIVEEELVLHGGRQRGLIAEGPDVALSPHAALSLSMALHELGTNAAKYGALQSPKGQILVSWTVSRDRYSRPEQARLTWEERHGPPVEPPTRRGFGSRLLEAMAADLRGAAELSFERPGLRWTVSFQLAADAEAAA